MMDRAPVDGVFLKRNEKTVSIDSKAVCVSGGMRGNNAYGRFHQAMAIPSAHGNHSSQQRSRCDQHDN
jgi:hypothetical protein